MSTPSPARRGRNVPVRRARAFTACLTVCDALGVCDGSESAAEVLMDCWHTLRRRPGSARADRALTIGYGILAAHQLAQEVNHVR